MPWKQWAYLEKVSSAEFQSYLQNQVVAVFTTAAQRATQLPAPAEGMVSYLQDIDALHVFKDGAWNPPWTAPWGKIVTATSVVSGGGSFASPTVTMTCTVPAGLLTTRLYRWTLQGALSYDAGTGLVVGLYNPANALVRQIHNIGSGFPPDTKYLGNTFVGPGTEMATAGAWSIKISKWPGGTGNVFYPYNQAGAAGGMTLEDIGPV